MDSEKRDTWLDSETKVSEAPGQHGQDTRLWLRLLTCSTLVENEIRRRLRFEFDTTLPRFDLLAQLERAQEGMVLGELSKRMMVSAGNLTALVDRLVECGHISRTTSRSDRRVQIISLTPQGREWFRVVTTRHRDWLKHLFADLSPGDTDVLLSALGRLKNSIRHGITGDPTSGGNKL